MRGGEIRPARIHQGNIDQRRLNIHGSSLVSSSETPRQRQPHECDINLLRSGVGHLRPEVPEHPETSLVLDLVDTGLGFNTTTIFDGAVGAPLRLGGLHFFGLNLSQYVCGKEADHLCLVRSSHSRLYRNSAPQNQHHWWWA